MYLKVLNIVTNSRGKKPVFYAKKYSDFVILSVLSVRYISWHNLGGCFITSIGVSALVI